MLVLGQAASTAGALSSTNASTSSSGARCRSSSSAPLSSSKLIHPKATLFSKRNTKFSSLDPRKVHHRLPHASAKSNEGIDSPSSSTATAEQPTLVSGDSVPLEGVIQFEKPNSSSRVEKWGRISLLAGGDVLALVLFSAVGRFSHGFSVFDIETLKTADPFVAGWFLGAYFLGGFDEDGRGMNGLSKAVSAAAKSWAVGIILGLGIRSVTLGHLPPLNFSLVSVGSTAVLLIGWRAFLFSIISGDKGKKDDEYKKGSPFELFETSKNQNYANTIEAWVSIYRYEFSTSINASANNYVYIKVWIGMFERENFKHKQYNDVENHMEFGNQGSMIDDRTKSKYITVELYRFMA
ncbi:hypothetical protein V2J09_007093 [Rumex salicifolius]